MEKRIILENLNSIQHKLSECKNELNSLVSEPIWDKKIADEIDDTVIVLQNISGLINDLVDIQRRIIIKK